MEKQAQMLIIAMENQDEGLYCPVALLLVHCSHIYFIGFVAELRLRIITSNDRPLSYSIIYRDTINITSNDYSPQSSAELIATNDQTFSCPIHSSVWTVFTMLFCSQTSQQCLTQQSSLSYWDAILAITASNGYVALSLFHLVHLCFLSRVRNKY